MNIISKKNWYFLFSILIIIPGIVFFVLNFAKFGFGLNLGIDFTGGSRVEIQGDRERIAEVFREESIQVNSVQEVENNRFIVRTKPLDEKTHKDLGANLEENKLKELNFQTIGPTIGKETTANALKAIVISSVLIILYITWSFRKVPHPASSLRFGICAIIALIHDVLVVVGVFAALGYFLKVEVDSLFVTALLTIIGFSVHDTIVVFDRIRENLIKFGSNNFEKTVNDSILQTLNRSLITSLTVIIVMVSLLLFGGESIRWFTVALLVGIISGTYSSIFNAAPLLVFWQELRGRR
jgi:preprotein translocase subunit SecF